MTDLPRTYAVLVHCYPRRWRANGRDEELLSVLLDAADAAGRARPSAAECFDVGLHGVAERLRPMSIVISADVRLRIAQVSIAIGAALSIFLVVFGELRVPGLSNGTSPNHLDVFLRQSDGPFLTVGIAIYATWLLILVSYVAGAARLCRDLALTAVGLSLLTPALGILLHHQRPPGGLLAAITLIAVGAAALPLTGRATLRRRLLTAAAVLVLSAALIGWRLWSLRDLPPGLPRSSLTSRPMFYWNPNGDYLQINRALAGPATWLVAAAGLLGLALWRRHPLWLPVVACTAVPVSCLRLGTSIFAAPHAQRDVVVWILAAVGVAVINYVAVMRIIVLRSRSGARRRDFGGRLGSATR